MIKSRRKLSVSKVLLIGTPNSGKSLLFNKLTGLSQKVANFPGVTVDVSTGTSTANDQVDIVDFPGIYSLNPISSDERVAVDSFKSSIEEKNLDLVICLMDATRFERGLYFALQVLRECQAKGQPVLLLANMVDVINKHNVPFDAIGLGEKLGVPVIPLSAKTGEGVDILNNELKSNIAKFKPENQLKFDLQNKTDDELRSDAHDISRTYCKNDDILIKSQMKLDKFLLHSFSGGIVFFAVMYLIFQSIFTWAAPAMDAVEGSVAWAAGKVLPMIPPGIFHDFMNDAVFGGIGAFLVFIPQIFVLTFLVGVLEDSGYLSRAAVICHRPLRFFGLTGKSFVPMLSGVACAIPGIYAARTIASPKRRWLTYFALPLMPCSARLPVYALLIAAFIPATTVGGIFGLQGLALFALYFFGIFSGLIVSAVLSKTNSAPDSDLPFVLEMTPYRWPSIGPLLRDSWNRAKGFVTKAGYMIFFATVAVWILGYFPNHGTDLSTSWLSSIGKIIEPIFAPLGLDWKYGVAIMMSFLAREVFVGTLGTLFGIEGADENIMGLADQIAASGLTMASAMALLVFFAIAMQCVSTLAVLKKESGSWKLPTQVFVVYSVLAYVLAYITYVIV